MDAVWPAIDSDRREAAHLGLGDSAPACRLGMVLNARFEDDRFGLDDADVDGFGSTLAPRLPARARRWIIFYIAWLLREELGCKTARPVWFQVVSTLRSALQSSSSECLVEGMEPNDGDVWLARFDRWLAQHAEEAWDALPVEVHTAGILLALDARGVAGAGVHLMDVEFAVAAVLIEVRLRTKDWIDEAVSVSVDKPY